MKKILVLTFFIFLFLPIVLFFKNKYSVDIPYISEVFQKSDIVADNSSKKESSDDQKPELEVEDNETTQNDAIKTEPNEEPKFKQELPKKYEVGVPFTSQAPYANWDQPYEDACEEASLIMASWYFKGENKIQKDSANSEILRVVAWENVFFGFYNSTNTKETAQMAENYFELQTEIIEDVTVEKIKQELYSGRLVIVPSAGRKLGNPNFSGQGPLYHMLVIRGWDNDEFITNDPGTRKGEGYRYKYDVVISATRDYNNGDIYNGIPMFISVWK